MNLRGSIAIVSGAAGALGSVVADRLLTAGASLALPLRAPDDEHRLPPSLRSAPDRVLTPIVSLTEESSVRACVDAVTARWGSVDILVNLAGGYAGGKTIDEMSLEEWEGMIGTNLTTAFLLTRQVLPSMKAHRRGRILSIAAMPAVTSGAGRGAYAVAKRGVITLTETVAEEVKGMGITANAIAPSIIHTAANVAAMPDADHRLWVTPQEIAELILFLCSESARSITGNVIRIFGGV